MNKDRKKDKKIRMKKDHFKRAGVYEVLDQNGNRLYLITKNNRIIHRGTLDDHLPRPNVEAHTVEF